MVLQGLLIPLLEGLDVEDFRHRLPDPFHEDRRNDRWQ